MTFINERLAAFVECSGLSALSFAEKCGLDQSNLSKMLSGKIAITAATIGKISDAMCLNPAWLETGEGDMMLPGFTVRKRLKKMQPARFIPLLLSRERLAGWVAVEHVLGYRVNAESRRVEIAPDSQAREAFELDEWVELDLTEDEFPL